MKRISRNLTAAALASSLTMAGVAAASAEENTELNGNNLVDTVMTATENGTEGENGAGETGKTEGSKTETGKTEGGKTETGKTEGENGAGETGKTEGGKTEGGKTETGKTETGKTEGGKTEGGKTDGENSKDPIVPIKAPAEGNNKKPTGENKPGNNNADNKEKSSFDDFKAKLSSEDGKPTKLGIAGIVIGVLGAIAAAVPAAAQALNIKLPF